MRVTAALLPIVLLAGCAASDEAGYPSLAPRPIERIDIGPEPVAEPVAPVPLDPAVAGRVAAAVARAAAGDKAFAGEQRAAEAAVRTAAGRTAGEDRWIEAQQALSRLQAMRLETADALQAIDDEQTAIGGAPSAELDAARDGVAALDRKQAEALDALSARLSAPRS